MKAVLKMVAVLTLLGFAGIQARVLPDYPNDRSLRKTNNGGRATSFPSRDSSSAAAAEIHIRMSTSAALQHLTSRSLAEIICKWLINITNWATAILCDKAVISTDLGKTPAKAPPSPKPAPGTRPLVAY